MLGIQPASPEKVQELTDSMVRDSQMDKGYLALLIVAAIVASLGLEQNSAATIIGAMVVAPLMLPIRSLGYSLLRFERRLIFSSLRTLILSIITVIALSIVIGLVSKRPELGSEITSRTSVTFLGLGVAFAGGILSAISEAERESKITDSLVGVGIAVSLVPPLCVVGVTLSRLAWADSMGAALLFFTNLVGISLACMLVFWLSGYQPRAQWRAYAGLAIFAILLLSITPALATASYQASQLSKIESFVQTQLNTYIPSAIGGITTNINWKKEPPELEIVLRSLKTPTPEEVRHLQAAINLDSRKNYRLIVIQDATNWITPDTSSHVKPKPI